MCDPLTRPVIKYIFSLVSLFDHVFWRLIIMSMQLLTSNIWLCPPSLSWITTLRSATPCQTPQTLSSTWSSRCSWAKYSVSVCFCHFHVVQTFIPLFLIIILPVARVPVLIWSLHPMHYYVSGKLVSVGVNWLQYLISPQFILIVDKWQSNWHY